MLKLILLGGGALVFVAAGLLLIRQGLKKEDAQTKMARIHYVPTRNYGKIFLIAFGILCIIIGVALLLRISSNAHP